MGVITHSSPLGMSAHFKAERDIILFDMDIVVGRDKLWLDRNSCFYQPSRLTIEMKNSTGSARNIELKFIKDWNLGDITAGG